MGKLAVVALGGNALLRENEMGTIQDQEKNAVDSIQGIISLIRKGYNLIITHGNGPQVGNVLMRNDAGEKVYDIAPMPLDICVADLQGGIGYLIERMIRNVLKKHSIEKNIITVVSMVEVSPNDPAFKNPCKRIGKVYDKQESTKLVEEKGWFFKPSDKENGGYRRVVPSPAPLKIINADIIKKLAKEGYIVISLGGGGIPVYNDIDNTLLPIDAVIDKDMASSLLAINLRADELYILTDVPYIYKDFGKPKQKKLKHLNYSDTIKYLEMGIFGEGSMSPKIKACLNFIKNGGEKSIITEASKLDDKSFGSKITMHY